MQTTAIADVAFDEMHSLRQLVAAAARQVVVADHPMPGRDEPAAQRRSDEAGSAGDEHGSARSRSGAAPVTPASSGDP